MVKGGSLLILRFVGQRSRSQLLKIEKQIDTFFVSAQYDERKKPVEVVGQRSRSYCPSTCSQLGFHTFGALLIFLIIHASIMVF
jgi:hypothetical protein